MTKTAETAFAKVNLALHIRRREPDGYHAIETLFAFAEDGDVLQIDDAPGLRITGRFGAGLPAGADNLVMRAADAFASLTGHKRDAGFTLDKRLPVAAGIGGGSADAAAALRLLCARHDIDPAEPRISALAASLGADIPACLLSRSVRGEGRGDRLASLSDIPSGQPLLLINPLLPLATGRVFAAWDGLDRGPLGRGNSLEAARAGRNDLEAPAIAIMPIIGTLLDLLRAQEGSVLVRMSGSGATCFALFVDDRARDQAARTIGLAQPGWWQLATRLR
ncbi:MAG TPA: 4-(cytidine 5'-diphospho)-2-C-methyl-D-erythritol kinase [Sphingomonas sp.]|nr:4-(cytidine 5'-diphospho)-2-C-methyl-D-erythritol kinase [Sphingomonas sp.]